MTTQLTSDDCKTYIVNWYAQNRNALPFFQFALPLDSRGRSGGLSNGLSKSSWSRQAVSKINDKIYRLFSPNGTVIDPSVYILLIEHQGKIESITVGAASDFQQYFSKIGYWA